MGADEEVVAVAAPEAEAAPQQWKSKWGIEGLKESLEVALGPYIGESGEASDDLVKKVQQKITKTSTKMQKDERASQRSTDTLAKVLVEEFVDQALGAVQCSLYDQDWLSKVEWTIPLLQATNYTFQGAKAFQRTLSPSVEKFVEEGIQKYQEEERITKVMYTALEQAGVQETHMKKASQFLLKAFNQAHIDAPYGSHEDVAASADLALLCDFIKGWMLEFLGLAYGSVLEAGIGEHSGNRDSQVLFITVLFQYLTSPDVAVVPLGILSRLGSLPAAPWDFIGACAEKSLTQLESNPKSQVSWSQKKRKHNGGDEEGGKKAKAE